MESVTRIKVYFNNGVSCQSPWQVGLQDGHAITEHLGSFREPAAAVSHAVVMCNQHTADIVLPKELLPMLGKPVDNSLDFDGLLDELRATKPTLTLTGQTPLEVAAYNWGWDAWVCGHRITNLLGPARRGWQDAHDNYEEQRRSEIELFDQLINGGRNG